MRKRRENQRGWGAGQEYVGMMKRLSDLDDRDDHLFPFLLALIFSFVL